MNGVWLILDVDWICDSLRITPEGLRWSLTTARCYDLLSVLDAWIEYVDWQTSDDLAGRLTDGLSMPLDDIDWALGFRFA